MTDANDYQRYRGNCKKYCERAVRLFPSLSIVRGHYECFFWGFQPHWWCVRPDGTVFDPTRKQFPSKGLGDYIPFDGTVTCSKCGKKGPEEDFRYESNYAFCSIECLMRFVGL